MAKQVAESTFEFLHIELVDYVKRQCTLSWNENKENKASDVKQLQTKINTKLENMGFNVGERLAERYTKEQTWLVTEMDIIKFICKEFWALVFKRQIDKLQTNYKGIYVLHDQQFRWIMRLSYLGSAVEEARPYTAFACGILRGALSNLGINATVKAELVKIPSCAFTITTVEKKAARLPASPPVAANLAFASPFAGGAGGGAGAGAGGGTAAGVASAAGSASVAAAGGVAVSGATGGGSLPVGASTVGAGAPGGPAGVAAASGAGTGRS